MLQRLFLDTVWLQTYFKIESPQFSISISDSLVQNHCYICYEVEEDLKKISDNG